jgi:DNA-binding response OmpR family regulator
VCNVELNEEKQVATISGEHTVELTQIEFRLLRYFMLNRNKVLSASQLRAHVYSNDGEPNSNVLEVYINRLRSKLGHNLITTRRGQGYVFGY